ncbi:MAG: carboxypeptidase-like regulatory domain-containing protein [Bacteroidia bacterium]
MKKYIFLFLLCFQTALLAATVPADKVYFISGTVSDAQTGETLAGVEIRIEGSTQVIYTDLDGRFSLADLPEGETVLVVNYQMYENKTVTLNVNSAGNGAYGEQQINIQLNGH